ncbi:hybrid-cluster NAD(P)-dependent oxidoreductase [Bosea vestrisii]|uniref:hybrid-cluster NAD(P)-dependent oxidoreductase n=1 Tax=Bosea vestrisii TaxID=151416 RepID=UPI0024DF9204|nr:hybrid-cluster NAD(P)-dependent oxidoreductase [Bosea vestrisii]WID96635.1 hybrid-cluster NAD(P)-dependent oxidoreductase [Bosea vestrisii]
MSAGEDAGFLRLTLVEVRPETHDVKTFVFRPEGGVPAYEAGQSMTLRLTLDGETLFRTFSLASAPGRGDTIAMTIKAHAPGRATRWLHETLKVGDSIEGGSPRGRFTIASRQTERLALVSAGSGASPLMAMLRHLADTALESDIAWLHGARTPADMLFPGELAGLQRRMPNLRVAMVASRPEPGWFGFTGRLSRRLVSVALPDLGRREVFCCGPAGFMDEARLIHAAEGGRRELFHVEHFGAIAAPAPIAVAADAPAAGFAIRFGDKRFTARADETLLEAATRQAIVIPCGCASGMCGTCRVSLVEGEVAMQHNGGISLEEEAERYILACSSRPCSNVTIAL